MTFDQVLNIATQMLLGGVLCVAILLVSLLGIALFFLSGAVVVFMISDAVSFLRDEDKSNRKWAIGQIILAIALIPVVLLVWTFLIWVAVSYDPFVIFQG